MGMPRFALLVVRFSLFVFLFQIKSAIPFLCASAKFSFFFLMGVPVLRCGHAIQILYIYLFIKYLLY